MLFPTKRIKKSMKHFDVGCTIKIHLLQTNEK